MLYSVLIKYLIYFTDIVVIFISCTQNFKTENLFYLLKNKDFKKDIFYNQ